MGRANKVGDGKTPTSSDVNQSRTYLRGSEVCAIVDFPPNVIASSRGSPK